ncbi:hypothetical protein TIFTF001_040787 [Ficus carica]|uniref:Uncharacterized protein n=1 Tax=Ficus carica TaxID=3494 RepID=A0AA87Z7G0_FICCA|nr:hypothetical protein TIFTF001_040787 [Ficus carica]
MKSLFLAIDFEFEMVAKPPSVAREEVKATETIHSDPRT